MNSCLLTLSVSVLVDRLLKLSPNLFERLAHLISIRRITMRAGRADETLAKRLIVLDTDAEPVPFLSITSKSLPTRLPAVASGTKTRPTTVMPS